MPNASSIWGNGTITGVDGLLTAPNTATSGMFGIVLWVLIYLIIWISLTYATRYNPHGDKQSFMAASIIMSIISVLMATPSLQLISPVMVAIPTVLSVVGVMVVVRKND